MASKNQYFPQSVPHPGVDLREKLEELLMGPKEFAVRTGKPEKTIVAVLNGKSSITPEMAVQFENVLHIPAHFWLNRQLQFDEYEARLERQEILKESLSWAKQFPLKEMIQKGWLPDTAAIEDKTAALLAFFGLSSHTAWENFYFKQQLKVVFRISLAHTKEPYALSAWLRKGELQAAELPFRVYDENKFREALGRVKNIMAEHPADFFKQLQQTCLDAGVKVVYTSCLPKAPISGSTRWLSDNTPLIQLTGRYQRNDIFWFTFFHEAGHILLHGKKDIFLESIEYSDKDLEKEREADEFAIKWTFSREQQEEILRMSPISIDKISLFAKKINTHPAMILGRLQREKLISYSIGKQLLKSVDLDDSITL